MRKAVRLKKAVKQALDALNETKREINARHGFDWDTIPAEEQKRMIEHVRALDAAQTAAKATRR